MLRKKGTACLHAARGRSVIQASFRGGSQCSFSQMIIIIIEVVQLFNPIQSHTRCMTGRVCSASIVLTLAVIHQDPYWANW